MTTKKTTKAKGIKKAPEAKGPTLAEIKERARQKVAEVKEAEQKTKGNRTGITKPGICKAIFDAISQTDKPISKKEILTTVVKLFPDRPEKAIWNTINRFAFGNKRPSLLEEKHKIILTRTDDGLVMLKK